MEREFTNQMDVIAFVSLSSSFPSLGQYVIFLFVCLQDTQLVCFNFQSLTQSQTKLHSTLNAKSRSDTGYQSDKVVLRGWLT